MSDLKVNEIKTDTIKNQAGTTAMTISSDGFVSNGKRLGFYATRDTAQSIPNGTWTVIQFDNVGVNDQSGFTTGSDAKFVVPAGAAGLYHIHGHIRFETGTDFPMGLALYWRVSGGSSSQIANAYDDSTYYTGLDCQTLRVLAVGDELQLRAYQGSGGAVNLGSNDGVSGNSVVRFLGYRIS